METTEKSTDIAAMMQTYISTFTPKEQKAYDIAKSHLGMSFQLEKCNGFLEWKKSQADTAMKAFQ